jgi:hypothetical protein
MDPSKVKREKMSKLTDLPNIAKAGAVDLEVLGIDKPGDLKGLDPYDMFERLCALTAKSTEQRHDPCVIDVFISVTSFINGGEPKPWWNFTAERKRVQSAQNMKQN